MRKDGIDQIDKFEKLLDNFHFIEENNRNNLSTLDRKFNRLKDMRYFFVSEVGKYLYFQVALHYYTMDKKIPYNGMLHHSFRKILKEYEKADPDPIITYRWWQKRIGKIHQHRKRLQAVVDQNIEDGKCPNCKRRLEYKGKCFNCKLKF